MDSVQLKAILEEQFGIVCRDSKRSKALCFDLKNGESFFLKRRSEDRGAQLAPYSRYPLVVHLKFESQILNLIKAQGYTSEIQVGGPTKSTGFITFRDQLSMQNSLTPTGLALNVRTKDALTKLLSILTGTACVVEQPNASLTDVEDEFTGCLHGVASLATRKEQQTLRSLLLQNNSVGECTLCARQFPADFLVAAHIKPRQFCTEEEMRDLKHVATLMCVAGCDTAFEKGYLVVKNGKVTRNRPNALTPSLDTLLNQADGNLVKNWHLASKYYREHAVLHGGQL